MPEFSVEFDKVYKSWVLYECPEGEVLFQQVAMNHEFTKEQRTEVEAWANALIHSWGYQAFATVKES